MKFSAHQYRRLGPEEYAIWFAEQNNVNLDTKSVSLFTDMSEIHDALYIKSEGEEINPVPVPSIPEENPFTEEIQQYDSWTVKELKAELQTRELPIYGTKAELGLRLKQNDIPSDTDTSEAPTEEVAAADLSDAPTDDVAVTEGENENEPTSGTEQEPIIEE
jgi:hypothetical protein